MTEETVIWVEGVTLKRNGWKNRHSAISAAAAFHAIFVYSTDSQRCFKRRLVKVMDLCLGELPFVPLTAYHNRLTHSLFYRHRAHLSVKGLLSLQDELKNTPNWKGSADPCDNWEGIRCTNSRVTSFGDRVLRNNWLNGTLDVGTAYSNQLQLIDLQNNSIENFTGSGIRYNKKLILVDNPFCKNNNESCCMVPQLKNSTFSTPPNNYQPINCNLGQDSNPSCKCAYSYKELYFFKHLPSQI
ncbi:hypothetical protein CFP56_010719 [Quercus suber]|uniref:Leucine-rich repeat-containing N-terminal plant-type domain-containing protein n=1 Tax=Quercus suber TaxID=58331 RepID=A0AAW0L158_QUESU